MFAQEKYRSSQIDMETTKLQNRGSQVRALPLLPDFLPDILPNQPLVFIGPLPTSNCRQQTAMPGRPSRSVRARYPASIGTRERPCDDGSLPPRRRFRWLCSARLARPTPSLWIASRRRPFRPTSNRLSSFSGDGTTAGMTMAGADPATTGADTPSAAVSAGAAAPAGTVGMAEDVVRVQVGRALVGQAWVGRE
jgi:hypothetical protein